MPLACLSTRVEKNERPAFNRGRKIGAFGSSCTEGDGGHGTHPCLPRGGGVCSTDVGYWRSGSPRLRLPVILGLTAALAAKAMGCRVILAGVSKDALRLHTARDLDVPCVVNSEKKIWRQS